jgi:hypothetical protein
MSTVIAAAAALALAAFGLVRGTWAAGGSDSSCYALMARSFATGELQPSLPLVTQAPWPDAARTFAPGGFIPSPIHPDAAAPICAPGMSVLMAPLAALFGQDAIFWLTPLAAVALVMSAYVIARQLAGGKAGATAAILTATSPIVLFQAVQPMNDILTAALWLTAIALGRWSAISGVVIGLSIFVRPNLAPAAIVLAAMPLIQPRPIDQRFRSLALMVAGAMPAVIALLWLNRALYGSVLGSGYGPAGELFSIHHLNDNLANYGRAAFATQHVLPVIGLLAPLVLTGLPRRGSWLLLAFAAVVTVPYLFYQPFPEWWYLRFLIPALIVLLILASAAGVHILAKARMGGLVPIVTVVLAILGVRAAGDREAFALQEMEGRFRDTGALVRNRLPDNAVLITVWQSGSMRFHAGREAVLWDSLDPAWLDRAVTWLGSQGLQPYLLIERREELDFRARFRGQSDLGRLDWPPRFDVSRQVRIYDPADRARYLAGESYATENVRSRPNRLGRR